MGPFSVEFQHLGEASFSTTPGLPHAPHTSLRAEAKMHGDVYFTGGVSQGHTVALCLETPPLRDQTSLLEMRMSRPPAHYKLQENRVHPVIAVTRPTT